MKNTATPSAGQDPDKHQQAALPGMYADGRSAMLAVLILLALLQAAAAAAAALATRQLFAALGAHAALPAASLWLLGGSGLVIAASRASFRTLGEKMGQDYLRDIRIALFDQTSRMYPDDVAARRTGYLSMRFIGDLSALKAWPARGVPLLVEACVMIPAMIGVLFVLDSTFGWLGLALAALVTVSLFAAAPFLLQAHATLRESRARLAADLAERMPIAPHLAAAGRRNAEIDLIRRRAAELTRKAVKRVGQVEALRALTYVAQPLAAVGIIWSGAAAGHHTGTIAGGLSALALMVMPLRNQMGVIDRLSAFRAAHQRLVINFRRRLLPNQSGPRHKLNEKEAVALRIELMLPDNPTPLVREFTAGTHAVLDLPAKADLDIKQLWALIFSLAPPDRGRVLLAGQPADAFRTDSLRRTVGLISTSPLVLKGSLRRVLTLGLRRLDDRHLLERLQQAGLLPLLEDLGGLNRRLPEGARTLPEHRRLSISVLQTALRQPGLILVDSPPFGPHADLIRTWLTATTATVVYPDCPAVSERPSEAKAV